MAVAGKLLKELIRKEVDKNIEKLDYEVDCIVKDLRKGKGAGLNIKKTQKFIVDAGKAIVIINKSVETIKIIRTALKASTVAAEATEKASTVGSALNPASAAIAYLTRFVVEGLKKEDRGLKNVVKIVPSITQNYKRFLKRAAQTIAVALAAKALKENVAKDRKKEVG
jgi:hypothetical protein|tara:strand:+ start:1137 stop:1640 length:504 start_codon:yes stop_codon:yes gene_type:complete